MANTVVTILLFLGMITDVFLLCTTVLNCRSEKKNHFIFGLFCIFLYILGGFMEVTSHSVGGALVGVKIMYLGSCFLPPFFLLFVADYCELRLKRGGRLLRGLVFLIPAINLLLIWTTEYTHLVYRQFAYTTEGTVHGLQVIEQGPAYYMVYCYSVLCIVVSSAILIHRMIRWNKSFRLALVLLLLSSAAPLLANGLFIISTYVTRSDLHGINFTPYALIVTNLLVYLNVLRYDLLDFAPRARSASLDMVRDALIFLDGNMNCIASNRIARSLFPTLAQLGKGTPITGIEAWPKELSDLKTDGTHRDIRFRLGNGDQREFNAWISRVDEGKRIFGTVVLIQDITENVRLMKQLEAAAYTDGLTGLYNRRHFIELSKMQLDKAKRSALPCSFILFDLDYFKGVNDTWGHLAGDEVLRAVADQLKHTLRTYDIMARYGGEEFVICMSETEQAIALRLAERIRLAVEGMVCHFEGKEIKITCSLGVAETDGRHNIDEILQQADDAMYRAKEAGRNRVCCAPRFGTKDGGNDDKG